MDNIEDIYELTPLQQGILFHTLLEPKSGVYVEQMTFPMSGDFDIRSFKQAWQRVVDRHQALRTSFHWDDIEKPLQVVHKRVELLFDEHDWRKLSPEKQERRLEAFLREDRKRGFDLSEAPLIRMSVIRLEENDRELVSTFHHLILDGWSLQLVHNDFDAQLDAIYQGKDLNLPAPRPFGDYIAWLQQQNLTRAEAFWRRTLAGFTNPTPLLLRGPSNELSTEDEDYGGETLWLSEDLTTGLQEFARSNRLTMNTVIQGAWAILLGHYSGENDIVFGTVVSGRPPDLDGVESMVGMFINTLPVRVKLSPDQSLLAFLKRLQAHQYEARQYDYSPLIDVQKWSEVPRGTELFQTLVVWENYPTGGLTAEHVEEEGKRESQIFERLNYPLTVIAGPGRELFINVLYNFVRFDKATIERLLNHVKTLLHGFVANPESRLIELPWFTDSERNQLLVEWNDTASAFSPEVQNVTRMFEQQVELTPDASAVTFAGDELSYSELNARANKLAHHLRQVGAGPEAVVGIMMDRSMNMAIGILAILKAGAAYLPLDPQYPHERLSFMLEDSQARVLLTDERRLDTLGASTLRAVCPDRDRETIAAESDQDLSLDIAPDNSAYIIYTSGSTGRPKGVAMTHRPLVNLLHWQLQRSQGTAKTLQFTSLSFDVSFQEIFSTWCAGATLVLVTEELRRDARELWRCLAKENVQRLFLPFVALQQLAEVAQAEEVVPKSLQQIITAGEQPRTTPEIVRMLERLPGCTLENQYGPTEAHVVSSFTLTGSTSDWPRLPPIGHPICNARLHILNRQHQPLAVGIPGDLYIGGSVLARGYLNRPDLTAERFMPDPYGVEPGSRLYRTGDIACYLPDGSIEFLGRADHQVKIRGFRVELGEIEFVLGQREGVGDVVVVATDDAMGYKRLVAYVSSKNGNAPSATEMKDYASQRLPDYMVPSAFVLLDVLPLTPSGKIDRSALVSPDVPRPELNDRFELPRTAEEQVLVETWADVLGLKYVGIHDNFFELGGHSLLATRLVSRARDAFQLEVPLRLIFEALTVAKMAEAILKLKNKGEGSLAPSITRVTREAHRVEISEGGELTYLKP